MRKGVGVCGTSSRAQEARGEDRDGMREMSAPGKGRPKPLTFEHQVRTAVLASGCAARAAVEQVLSSARVYLSPVAFADYEKMVPNLRG
jgi:hypothetical protein